MESNCSLFGNFFKDGCVIQHKSEAQANRYTNGYKEDEILERKCAKYCSRKQSKQNGEEAFSFLIYAWSGQKLLPAI
jgi:hypothetical protein